MTVKLYVLPSSTSSRNAEQYFRKNNIEYDKQQIASHPLTWEQLLEILMHVENGVDDIISTRSKIYQTLMNQGVVFEELTLSELYNIIQQHPRLLRVPIMVGKSTTMVGYNSEDIRFWNSRESREKELLALLEKSRETEDMSLTISENIMAM